MTPPAQRQTAALPRIDRTAFLTNVRKSGLVPDDKLARALKTMPPTDKASGVARFLIGEKLLTKFQAERLLVGRTDGFVIGQYRILDEIGRGGMGRVLKAEHTTMHRVVAVKILEPALTKTQRAQDLFQREVRAAARLNHPNIVTAYDANQVGDRHYLVMEFVDGPNLADLVKEHGRLPVSQACEFIRQAAIGLQYAHELGMVHRDIKPANLLVQKSAMRAGGPPTLKILDFGLARLGASGLEGEAPLDSIELPQQSVMGTPDYLSPEQARCMHSVDARSDLYSLGCTFYFLLTGQVPFPDGAIVDKLVRHTSHEPVAVRQLRPDVPPEVEAIVSKLMAKNPSDRFQSAAELFTALTTPPTRSESGKWVPIMPRPADDNLRPSGAQLPRVRPILIHPDPWAQLNDEPDSALDHTLPVAGGASESTPLDPLRQNPRHSHSRTKHRRKKAGMAGSALVLLLICAVLMGAFLLIKLLVTKAGG